MLFDQRHEFGRAENAAQLLIRSVFEFRGVRFVNDIDQLGFAFIARFVDCYDEEVSFS